MNQRPTYNSDTLLELLDRENVNYRCISHKALMTVEDAKSIRTLKDSDQGQIKNLFVKNKKGTMWLLTLHEDTKIDLKATAQALGAKRFSFCSEDRLMQYLGVTPGAVSPLGLLNDQDCEVRFYIDEVLVDHPVIHVHPLVNTKTVTLGTRDLLDLLHNHGHPHNVFTRDLATVP